MLQVTSLKNASFLKRFFSGVGATFINQLTSLANQFVSIGIFISFWGEMYYAEWILIYSYCQYLTMGDVGVSATLSNKIASFIESKKTEEASKWFINGWIISTFFSLIFFLIIFFIILFFQKNNIKYISKNELYIFLSLLSIYLFIYIQSSLLSGIYSASLQFTRQKNIDTFAKLFDFIAILISLNLGGKVILTSALLILFRIFIFIFIIYDVKKRFHWIKLDVNSIQISTISAIIKPAFANMFLNLGYLLYYNGPVILVSNLLGNSYVPQYYAIITIIRAAKQVPYLITLPLYPEYARLIESKNLELARQMHRVALRLTFILAIVATLFIFFFSDFVIKMLLQNNSLIIDTPFFILCLVALLLQSIWHASSAVLVGSNNHIKLAYHFTLASFLGYTVMILSIENLKLTSVSLGLLVIDIFMTLTIFYQVFVLIDEKLENFFHFDLKKINILFKHD